MFLSLGSEFIQQLSDDGGQYVPVLEIIGEQRFNQILQMTASQQENVGEEEIRNIEEFVDALHVKFVTGDSMDELEQRDDIPNITSLVDFEKRVREEWDSVENRVIDTLLRKPEDEFPVFVDTFRVGGLLFALRVTDKLRNLEEALDIYVEMEKYERAADIRDELERLGSDKIIS